MNRAMLSLAALLAFVLLLVGSTVSAQNTPSNPPILQYTCPHVIRPGIPFAWLRETPSSFGVVAVTLTPGQNVFMENPPTLSFDGVQWWVFVLPNIRTTRPTYYWVETASLEARCQPTATPTLVATPTFTPAPNQGAASWRVNDVLRVHNRVQFVWYRDLPAPGRSPIFTAFPGQRMVVIEPNPATDAYQQWWWHVRDVRTGTTGWVEQNTVELVQQGSTTPPSEWRINDVVRVKFNVPFVWVRGTPSSVGIVVATVLASRELVITGAVQSDGVQNWWPVGVPRTASFGWVEESSLEFARR
ncbi:MAG: hypothetical protein JNJ61_24965 [Anaerolineae bacterium]|nr:hypothetical protein [Anaerolineae bacterium]